MPKYFGVGWGSALFGCVDHCTQQMDTLTIFIVPLRSFFVAIVLENVVIVFLLLLFLVRLFFLLKVTAVVFFPNVLCVHCIYSVARRNLRGNV